MSLIERILHRDRIAQQNLPPLPLLRGPARRLLRPENIAAAGAGLDELLQVGAEVDLHAVEAGGGVGFGWEGGDQGFDEAEERGGWWLWR